MNFEWAESYPDLIEHCKRFSLTEFISPSRICYKPLRSMLQDGPTCGLTALSLFIENDLSDIERNNFVIATAKERGYTYNGEMFDTSAMCNLANDLTKYNAKVHNGPLNSEFTIDFLLKGGCLLVPYDTDRNHAPCLSKGHKAHWAAISGIIEVNQSDYYVLAKQGKSRHLGIWKLKDLCASNSQLIEHSPDLLSCKLPQGGIVEGLCSKSILLYK